MNDYDSVPLTSIVYFQETKWDPIFIRYKRKLATLIFEIYNKFTPSCILDIIAKRNSNTNYITNSVAHRGSNTWNALLLPHYDQGARTTMRLCLYIKNVRKLQYYRVSISHHKQER